MPPGLRFPSLVCLCSSPPLVSWSWPWRFGIEPDAQLLDVGLQIVEAWTVFGRRRTEFGVPVSHHRGGLITASNAAWLADFTRKHVAQRLAACGHHIEVIRSTGTSAGESVPSTPKLHRSAPSARFTTRSSPEFVPTTRARRRRHRR